MLSLCPSIYLSLSLAAAFRVSLLLLFALWNAITYSHSGRQRFLARRMDRCDVAGRCDVKRKRKIGAHNRRIDEVFFTQP